MNTKLLNFVFAILLAFPALGEGLEGISGDTAAESVLKRPRTDAPSEAIADPREATAGVGEATAAVSYSVPMNNYTDLIRFLTSSDFYSILTSVPAQKDLSPEESVEREREIEAVERVCASLLYTFGRQDSRVGLDSAVDKAMIHLHNSRKSYLSAPAPSPLPSPAAAYSPSTVAAGMSPPVREVITLQPYQAGVHASVPSEPGLMSPYPLSGPGLGYAPRQWQIPYSQYAQYSLPSRLYHEPYVEARGLIPTPYGPGGVMSAPVAHAPAEGQAFHCTFPPQHSVPSAPYHGPYFPHTRGPSPVADPRGVMDMSAAYAFPGTFPAYAPSGSMSGLQPRPRTETLAESWLRYQSQHASEE